jgi:3-hydroxyisobutyrate dehydrogenase-like beta-hydroxyacid dehydrogenase
MILSLIESFSEATALLAKEGISVEKAAEIWGNSLFDSPAFHTYSPIIANKKYENGGFALNLGLKDIRLLKTCSDETQVPMPFLAELHAKLLASMNLGREKYDWSAIALLTHELAGLVS